jgi:hypothetical protein
LHVCGEGVQGYLGISASLGAVVIHLGFAQS